MRQDFGKKVVILIVFAVIVLTARHFGISCILLYFFGIPCPGCGMTRACLSALQFDFLKAYSYHRMFWSVPVLLLYFFCDGKVFRSRLADKIILIGIAAGFGVNWIINLTELLK